jgi:3-oxoacyl-[acyl-carrier protein] reductase
VSISSSTPLEGKTALVTGASRGLGAGIARELVRQGARVAITYRASREDAEALVAEIRQGQGDAMALRSDSSDPASIQQGVRDVVDAFGRLDILVNNAGGGWFEPFAETSNDHIEQTISLNIRGTIYATQEALKHLPDGGRIITIGSINAVSIPFTGGTIYGMSKAALVAFTQGLARELGPRGITVNIVHPGPIDTDGNPKGGPSAPMLAGLTALGYFGTPADVGSLVAWIASPSARYMTGSAVVIDGGWTA